MFHYLSRCLDRNYVVASENGLKANRFPHLSLAMQMKFLMRLLQMLSRDLHSKSKNRADLLFQMIGHLNSSAEGRGHVNIKTDDSLRTVK